MVRPRRWLSKFNTATLNHLREEDYFELQTTTYGRLAFSTRRQLSSTPSSLVQYKINPWLLHQHHRGVAVNSNPQPLIAKYCFKVVYISRVVCPGNTSSKCDGPVVVHLLLL